MENFFRQLKNPEFRKQIIEESEKKFEEDKQFLQEGQKNALKHGISIHNEADLRTQLEFLGKSEAEVGQFLQKFLEKKSDKMQVLVENKGKLMLTEFSEKTSDVDKNLVILVGPSLSHAIREFHKQEVSLQEIKNWKWEVPDAEIDDFIKGFKEKILQERSKNTNAK